MDLERRAALELRAAGDAKAPKLQGYASVFDSPSQDLGGFREVVKPGAFTRTLRSNAIDPLALVQHMPHLVLGRRGAGTLRLSEDAKGLAYEIDLPDTQAARDLLTSVKRGDTQGASIAFRARQPGGDRWSVRGDTVLRELIDLDLFEVTITAAPAYSDATVAVRALRDSGLAKTALCNADLGRVARWLASCR